MLSVTAPSPLVDMGLRESACRRERLVDDGSDRAGMEGQVLCDPRGPFRSNAADLFACSLQALRSHRDQSGTLRRSPMSATEVATIIKLQPTARAYRIIPLCTRGRSICLQQTELLASQAVSYYCFIPRPPAPCAPPAPYGPGSAPAALAPYLPLGRLHSHRAYR